MAMMSIETMYRTWTIASLLACGATVGCGGSSPDADAVVADASSVHTSGASATDLADGGEGSTTGSGGGGFSAGADAGTADAATRPASDGGADAFETHCPASGAIYYLAANGSDGAAGTVSAPWLTLTHAAKMVKPGDTVRIRGNGGTYYPTAEPQIDSVGTAESWICFEGAPGDAAPVFDGSKNGQYADGIRLAGQYLVLQNIVVQSSRFHGIEIGSGGHFVDIVGNQVLGSGQAGITAGPSSGDTTLTTDIRIHGNEVANNGLTGSGAPGNPANGTNWPAIVRSFGASRVSFTNNVVHENWGEGIDFILTHGGEATDNVSWNNYSVNLYVDNTDEVTVARNLVYWTGDKRFIRPDTKLGPAGFQLSEEGEYGVSIKLSHDTFVDNIAIGCSSGINYGTYGLNLGMDTVVFAGNTLDTTSTGGPPVTIGDSSGNTGNRLVDNIFLGGRVDLPATAGEISYGHNLFSGVPNGAQLKGAGDVLADPQLDSPGTFTAAAYQPKTGSPALHAGAADPALTTDCGGATRASPPSIGAWE